MTRRTGNLKDLAKNADRLSNAGSVAGAAITIIDTAGELDAVHTQGLKRTDALRRAHGKMLDELERLVEHHVAHVAADDGRDEAVEHEGTGVFGRFE